jgi:energy-coupling factor transporter ATP-binding protein EcfA2
MDDIQQKIDDLYLNGTTFHEEIVHKLPIEYIDHEVLSDVIREDLEIGSVQSLYRKFIPENSTLMNQWCSIYTKNTKFLKQTQKCIKRYSSMPYSCEVFKKEYDSFIQETNFIDKYQYIGFKMFKQLNESSGFLHCLSLYNLTSPIFSLISPLVMLLIPFMLLKLQKVPITITGYVQHLKNIFKHTSVYQLFFNFSSISFQSRVSAFFSLFIYVLQVYNNVLSCVSFYRNITKIYGFLMQYTDHLKQSLSLLERTIQSMSSYSTYQPFLMESMRQRDILQDMLRKIQEVQPCDSLLLKIGQIGVLMNLYYDLFMNEQNHLAIQYTFFLHDYNLDILSIQESIQKKHLNPCKYSKKTSIRGMYYLAHMNEPTTKNDVDLKKNIVISGPNASGKTTLLKSLFLNVIMSQQFGYGCYEKATIGCYDVFHSYLNIPDTSGRDSLFQAEARRCKEILDCITEYPEKRHLCIFDEIYSGTNPVDAVTCAKLYLKGLNHHKDKVDYLITTHYIALCEHFKDVPCVSNQKMSVRENLEKIEYDYKMVDGISYVNGGIFILKQLDYPSDLYESV